MANTPRSQLSAWAARLGDWLTPDRYRVVTRAALVLICGIVVSGAGVRLTGSGLGCTNWPTCDENVTPPLEYHAMVEFVNRMVTGVVSIAVIGAVLGSLVRRPKRRDLLHWSLGLVAGVLAQIVWGGVTVLSHLNPAVVSGHFLISMFLVWNAVVLHHRASLPDDAVKQPVTGRVTQLAWATAAWGAIALFTGPLVTGTGPHAGDASDPRVTRFDFDLLTIARVHSAFMWVYVLLLTATAVVAHRTPQPEPIRRVTRLTLAVAVAQGGIGYLQYFNGVPPWLVALHVAGATTLWTLTVHLALRSRDGSPERRAERPAAAYSTAAAA